jgi:phosphoribosylformylglycinamidine synthase
MVGLLPDVTTKVPSRFQRPGDQVALLGATTGHLGGSMYWWLVRDFLGGPPPPCDLAAERGLQRFLAAGAARRLLASAHDCADGGFAVAVAEACLGDPYGQATLGATLQLEGAAPAEGLLYGEDGARAVVSFRPESAEAVRRLANELGVPVAMIGTVGPVNGDLEITIGPERLRWQTGELRRIYYDAIPRRMSA